MLFRPAPLSGSIVRLLCLVSSPSFLAWLFSPAFKDNKVISSFSTFLRLLQSFFRVSSEFLLSFFDIPRNISRFSESLAALRIASLPSAPLLFLLSVFCLLSFLFLYSLFLSSFTPSHLLFSHFSFLISHFSSLHLYLFYLYFIFIIIFFSCLVLYCVLFFSFSSLSHLTFPASFSYSLRLFSLFSKPLGVLRIA